MYRRAGRYCKCLVHDRPHNRVQVRVQGPCRRLHGHSCTCLHSLQVCMFQSLASAALQMPQCRTLAVCTPGHKRCPAEGGLPPPRSSLCWRSRRRQRTARVLLLLAGLLVAASCTRRCRSWTARSCPARCRRTAPGWNGWQVVSWLQGHIVARSARNALDSACKGVRHRASFCMRHIHMTPPMESEGTTVQRTGNPCQQPNMVLATESVIPGRTLSCISCSRPVQYDEALGCRKSGQWVAPDHTCMHNHDA